MASGGGKGGEAVDRSFEAAEFPAPTCWRPDSVEPVAVSPAGPLPNTMRRAWYGRGMSAVGLARILGPLLTGLLLSCGPSREERLAEADRVVAAGRAPLEQQLARFEALLPLLRDTPRATEVHLPASVQLAFLDGGNAMFLELEQLEHLREPDYHTRLERMTPTVPRALAVLAYGPGGLGISDEPDTIEGMRSAISEALQAVIGVRYLLVVRPWDLTMPGVTAFHLRRPTDEVDLGEPLAEFSGGHLAGDALLVDVQSGEVIGAVPFDVTSSFEVEAFGPHPLLDDLTRHMVQALDEALAPIRTGTVY